jgi:hypothetical protein
MSGLPKSSWGAAFREADFFTSAGKSSASMFCHFSSSFAIAAFHPEFHPKRQYKDVGTRCGYSSGSGSLTTGG